MESLESPKIIYSCPECETTFMRSESLKKHMKTYHASIVIVCSNCPLFFDDLGKLFLHAREVHNPDKRNTDIVKKFPCKLCNYQTDNGGLHRHHMLSHLKMKPYVCQICNKSFTQKSNMKTHFHRHKKHENKFRCIECEQDFNSHDTLLSHLSTREHYLGTLTASKSVHYQCLVCLEEFNVPEDIYEHLFSCQLSVPCPVSCKTCFHKLPHDLEAIKDHSRSHTNQLICPLCDDFTVFTDKTKFNFHLTKIHGERVFRRPVCRYCELIFDNEDDKNNHINEMHQDLKNKHLSRGEQGRIQCPLKDCDFSTNSEIYAQKHFFQHFSKNDPDLYYNGQIKNEANVDNEPTVKPRKRGRPRLCDQTTNSLNSTFSTDNSEEQLEVRRKRGRPKKNEPKIELTGMTSIFLIIRYYPLLELKKRGRPKKVQINFEQDIEDLYRKPMKMEPVNMDDNYDINIFDNMGPNLIDQFDSQNLDPIIFNSFSIPSIDNLDPFNNFEDFQ